MTSIKSKPVYAPLRADTGGRYHLMLGMGSGTHALLRVLDELQAAAPDSLRRTQVLLAEDCTIDSFHTLALAEARSFADTPALLDEFSRVLDRSLMGTRLYIAGPESFIGRVMQLALAFDLNQDEIRAEAVGTLARRVHCVHCRATTENVRDNITSCGGCGRWLTVRDHYSRRLAAYMGVMVDAEAPGERPPVCELYS